MSHSDISPTKPDDAMAQLQRLRASIDNLDAILLHTLAERFKVTHAVQRLQLRDSGRRYLERPWPLDFAA